MIKSLGVPLRLSLTKMDELHLSDPSMVDGWNITHLSSTKVSLVFTLSSVYLEQVASCINL